MASPDLTRFIDLPLVDKDPQDVFVKALETLQTNFPEWVPREGNIEVLLMEALALEVAESIFAINRLPSAMTEVLLSMLNIQRDVGAPPTVDVMFDMGITTGTNIPAGVSLVLELDSGLDPIVFTTDSELVILPGEFFGVVSATGDRYTSDANDIQAGALLQIQDSLTYVNYAQTNSSVTGGREPEEDLGYLTRGIQRLERLTTTLLLPRHFETSALEFAFVKRAKALDNYDSDADIDGLGPVGDDAGFIAVAVYGDNEMVTDEQKEQVAEFYSANSMSNLIVTIIDPTITDVNITAEIRIDADALPSDVIDAVEEELRNFLNPMTWKWSTKVRKNELISIITNVPGVDYLETLELPTTDVTLPGVATLANAGILSISVVVD